VALWLRYMRLSACAYGVHFMTVTGVCDPHLLVMGDAAALYERTGIAQEKIIHVVWENEGYAAPAWLLVQDDLTHAVCLVISVYIHKHVLSLARARAHSLSHARTHTNKQTHTHTHKQGSKNNSDWLSNLRCANVDVRQVSFAPIVGLFPSNNRPLLQKTNEGVRQGDHFGPSIALSEEAQILKSLRPSIFTVKSLRKYLRAFPHQREHFFTLWCRHRLVAGGTYSESTR
jgi:hypothetical protein